MAGGHSVQTNKVRASKLALVLAYTRTYAVTSARNGQSQTRCALTPSLPREHAIAACPAR